MTKEELIRILNREDYFDTGAIEDGYMVFVNEDEEFIWVGNAFIEMEWSNIAFPYKHYGEDELIMFISYDTDCFN